MPTMQGDPYEWGIFFLTSEREGVVLAVSSNDKGKSAASGCFAILGHIRLSAELCGIPRAHTIRTAHCGSSNPNALLPSAPRSQFPRSLAAGNIYNACFARIYTPWCFDDCTLVRSPHTLHEDSGAKKTHIDRRPSPRS